MMEVSQNADEVLSETQINNTTVPIIGKREISAQVGVQSRQTVVLGGLVRTDNSKARTKVPVLGDIPLIGALFRADTKRRARSELMVLITPYVLKTPQEALDETQRLYSNSKTSTAKWHSGWSDSVLPRKKLEEAEKARNLYFPPEARPKKQTLFGPSESSRKETPAEIPAEPLPRAQLAPAEVLPAGPAASVEVKYIPADEPAAPVEKQPEPAGSTPPAVVPGEAPVVEAPAANTAAPTAEGASEPVPAR
jgi:hypothetical protein